MKKISENINNSFNYILRVCHIIFNILKYPTLSGSNVTCKRISLCCAKVEQEKTPQPQTAKHQRTKTVTYRLYVPQYRFLFIKHNLPQLISRSCFISLPIWNNVQLPFSRLLWPIRSSNNSLI